MSKTIAKPIAILLFIALTGCAGLPKLEVGYYLPQTSMNVTVNQLISCTPGTKKKDKDGKDIKDKDGNVILVDRRLLFAYVVTPSIVHQADLSALRKLDLEKLEKAHSNVELDFGFFPDGRLKSVGTKTVGQGKAILDSAIAVANVVWPLSLVGDRTNQDEACDYIQRATGKTDGTGVLAISYSTKEPINITNASKKMPDLNATESTEAHYTELVSDGVLPTLELKAVDAHGSILPNANTAQLKHPFPSGITGGADRQPDEDCTIKTTVDRLILRDTALVRVAITADGASPPIWRGRAIAADNSCYTVPLLESTLFGSRYFRIALDESGMATALEFDSAQGLSDVLGAIGSAATAVSPPDSAEAAALKAQSDLIYQQQRLLRCKADPASCVP